MLISGWRESKSQEKSGNYEEGELPPPEHGAESPPPWSDGEEDGTSGVVRIPKDTGAEYSWYDVHTPSERLGGGNRVSTVIYDLMTLVGQKTKNLEAYLVKNIMRYPFPGIKPALGEVRPDQKVEVANLCNSILKNAFITNVNSEYPPKGPKAWFFRRLGFHHRMIFNSSMQQLNQQSGVALFSAYLTGLDDIVCSQKFLTIVDPEQVFALSLQEKIHRLPDIFDMLLTNNLTELDMRSQDLVDAVVPFGVPLYEIDQLNQNRDFWRERDPRKLFTGFFRESVYFLFVRAFNQQILRVTAPVVESDLMVKGPASEQNCFASILRSKNYLVSHYKSFPIEIPIEDEPDTTFKVSFHTAANIRNLRLEKPNQKIKLGNIELTNYSGIAGKALISIGLPRMQAGDTDYIDSVPYNLGRQRFIVLQNNVEEEKEIRSPLTFTTIDSPLNINCSRTVLKVAVEQFYLISTGEKVVLSQLNTNGIKSENHCHRSSCRDRANHLSGVLLGCSCWCTSPQEDGPQLSHLQVCLKVSETAFREKDEQILFDPYQTMLNPREFPLNVIMYRFKGGRLLFAPRSGVTFDTPPVEFRPLFSAAVDQETAQQICLYKERAVWREYLTYATDSKHYYSNLYNRKIKVDPIMRSGLAQINSDPHVYRAQFPSLAPCFVRQRIHFQEKQAFLGKKELSMGETAIEVVRALHPNPTPENILDQVVWCPVCTISIEVRSYPSHYAASHPHQEALNLVCDQLGTNVRSTQAVMIDTVSRLCQTLTVQDSTIELELRNAQKIIAEEKQQVMELRSKIAALEGHATALQQKYHAEVREHEATKKKLTHEDIEGLKYDLKAAKEARVKLSDENRQLRREVKSLAEEKTALVKEFDEEREKMEQNVRQEKRQSKRSSKRTPTPPPGPSAKIKKTDNAAAIFQTRPLEVGLKKITLKDSGIPPTE